MLDRTWITGDGAEIHSDNLIDTINQYVDDLGKIFIGTDSQIQNNRCTFVTAICLHGKPGERGGRYFFTRFDESIENKILKLRMIDEAHYTIDIANKLIEINPNADIEIHIDVGSTKKSKTRDFVDMLSGWAAASGFAYKIKPDAWASYSVADKHTKKRRTKKSKIKR